MHRHLQTYPSLSWPQRPLPNHYQQLCCSATSAMRPVTCRCYATLCAGVTQACPKNQPTNQPASQPASQPANQPYMEWTQHTTTFETYQVFRFRTTQKGGASLRSPQLLKQSFTNREDWEVMWTHLGSQSLSHWGGLKNPQLRLWDLHQK